MAHIKINRNEFEQLVGEEIDDEKLKEDASFLGAHWNPVEEEKWDVEVYPNRPDLLSVEGLARAYKGYFGIEEGRESYDVKEGDVEVEVDGSVENVRPYIGGAVIRGLELDQRMINGLIQLQEKLHETMGRQRDKLAIGLHDIEGIEPPFTFEAVEPESVSFTPLEHDSEIHLEEILEKHEKGQEYAWILEDEDRYPVILDSNDKVLSFPPIINNQLTEVETGTEDIFIDVTGKDLGTVKKALNILVTALAERGGEIEEVEVDGETMPELSPGGRELELDYLEDVSGLELEPEEVAERLEQMRFGAEVAGEKVEVEVPPYRTDVMHSYDLIEDIVIAHRYNNIEPETPEIDQVSNESREEDYTRVLRDILQGTGALETHTYILSNEEKLFDRMELEREKVVKMSNALTEDYTCVRNWLLPSLMNVLKRNRHRSYPQKFFEVAEVSELDDSAVGASNTRKLAYVESGNDADYTDAKQVLQVVERDLGVDLEVKEGSKNCFRSDRAAEIFFQGDSVGFVGEFSEDVVENWELDRSIAGFELDLDKLLEKIVG